MNRETRRGALMATRIIVNGWSVDEEGSEQRVATALEFVSEKMTHEERNALGREISAKRDEMNARTYSDAIDELLKEHV